MVGDCFFIVPYNILPRNMCSLTGTPLGYVVVALCHGDPAALGLQDQPLHVLQQIRGGVGVGGQLLTLVLGLDSCRVGQSASFLLSLPAG